MNIVIIGSGNVAWFFAGKFKQHHHPILQIVSKDPAHAKALADSLQTDFTTDIDQINRNADLYLLAVSDTSISLLNKKLRLNDKVVLHTAGAVPLSAINDISQHTGVLYPLQTIRKAVPVKNAFPILLESADEITLEKLKMAAGAISNWQVEADYAKRVQLHLAAVFSNNFIHYLITLTKDYCEKESLPVDLLQPLIRETVERATATNGRQLQTGPAIRNDISTLKKHQELLNDYPQMKAVYELLSNNIRQFYHIS